MSQNSRCFPSLKCMSRSKSTTDSLKPSLRMPTIREFINRPNNAGTQTSICEGIFTKTEETHFFPAKQSTTPTNHRSTIVIRNPSSFVPLCSSESVKSVNKLTSNNSFLSQIGKGPSRDNTLFLSKGSFDEIFETLRAKNMENVVENKRLVDSKKEDSRSNRFSDPFVLTEQQKPRIVPITPMYRKRSLNGRPLLVNSVCQIGTQSK